MSRSHVTTALDPEGIEVEVDMDALEKQERDDRIAKLEKEYERASALRSAAADLFSHHNREANRLEADLAEAKGDTERATYLRLLSDPDAPEAEKHAAYIRVQARNVAEHPSVIEVLPERERPEILAEVERMKAEQANPQ